MSETSPEAQKPDEIKSEVKSRVLDPELEVDGKDLHELPKLLKWTYDFNKGDEHFSPKAAESLLKGAIRGVVTERASQLVALNEGEMVVPKEGTLKDYLGGCRTISGYDESIPTLGVYSERTRSGKKLSWGSQRGKKMGILQAATRSTISIPDNIPRREVPQYILELVEGYGGTPPRTGGEGSQAGLHYEETAMPDSFVMNSDDEFVGVVETKAYTPEEFSLYVRKAKEKGYLEVDVDYDEYYEATGVDAEHYGESMRLGFDIDGQQRMLDILRDAINEKEPLENTGIVLLRVPSDIVDDDIEELEQLSRRYGYGNLAVQKLPFTSDELDELGKRVVGKIGDDFSKHSNYRFANRELKILSEYAGVDLLESDG